MILDVLQVIKLIINPVHISANEFLPSLIIQEETSPEWKKKTGSHSSII